MSVAKQAYLFFCNYKQFVGRAIQRHWKLGEKAVDGGLSPSPFLEYLLLLLFHALRRGVQVTIPAHSPCTFGASDLH